LHILLIAAKTQDFNAASLAEYIVSKLDLLSYAILLTQKITNIQDIKSRENN